MSDFWMLVTFFLGFWGGLVVATLWVFEQNRTIVKLFGLLDDIDTASDRFKPEKTAFYDFVMAKAKERHIYFKLEDIYNWRKT